MKFTKIKKATLCFLLAGFLFSLAAPVLAFELEVKYPSLPGIGSLDKIKELPKEERLGFYVKYIVNLIFFIVAGICLIVLIVGGLMYLVGSQKTSLIITARGLIQQAFLGLFILVTSYLLLYTLNPQLLVFEPKIKPIEKFQGIEGSPPQAKVTLTAVSPTEAAVTVVSGLEKLVEVDQNTGEIINFNPVVFQPNKKNWLASLFRLGQAEALSPGLLVHTVEAPFFRIKITLDEIARILEGVHNPPGCAWDVETKPNVCDVVEPGLNDLLKQCRCGTSKSYLRKTGLLEFTCKPGLDDKERQDLINTYKDEWIVQGSQLQCLTGCDSCGLLGPVPAFNPNCDLREVRKREVSPTEQWIEILTDGKADTWEPIEILTFEAVNSRWLRDTAPGGKEFQRTSIKYKRLRLEELMGEVEAQRPKFSTEQLEEIAKVLKINAIDFLGANTQRTTFQSEFEVLRKGFESDGVVVEVKKPEQFFILGEGESISPPTSRANQFANTKKEGGLLAAFRKKLEETRRFFVQPVIAFTETEVGLAAATFFYPTKVENYPSLAAEWEVDMEANQRIEQEARRANLFSVLAEMTLEEIEAMFQSCLAAAFGEADYKLPGNMADIIREAIRQGTADYAVWQLAQNSAAFSDVVGQEILNDIDDEASLTLKKRCAKEVCGWAPPYDIEAPLNDDMAKEVNSLLDAFLQDKVNKDCTIKCIKENIPPRFISNQLGKLFTEPLKKRLPDEIEKLLDSELRDVIFEPDGKINQMLDSEMVKLYDEVLHGALQKSFSDQIPYVKDTLNTNIGNWLRESMLGKYIDKVDYFLDLQIKDLKKYVNEKTEEFVQGLGDEVNKVLGNKMEGLKKKMPGIFREYVSVADCYKRLFTEGEIFKCDEGSEGTCEGLVGEPESGPPGKCLKLTPEEISEGIRPPVSALPDGKLQIGPTIVSDGMKEEICHAAGYEWVEEWEMDNIHEGKRSGGWHCQDEWIDPIGSLKKVASLSELRKRGQEALAGFINFIEEFAVALTEVLTHTAIAYAQVWIEDTILAPMEPYLKQVIDFQEDLKGFLNSTVADVLPPQVVSTLNSNVDQIMKNICSMDLSDHPQNQPLNLNLYENTTWGGTWNVVNVKKETITAACQVSEHFHNTLLDELNAASDLFDNLTKTIEELLPGETIERYLNMSPAELIFLAYGIPPDTLLKLIRGTPKELLCGEIVKEQNGQFSVLAGDYLINRCNGLGLLNNPDLGTLPFVDVKSPAFKALSEDMQKFYRYYCPFVWGACKNPAIRLPLVGESIGALTEELVGRFCDWRKKQALDGCALGNCLGKGLTSEEMLGDGTCSGITKASCEGCNVAKENTMAYSLFYYLIRLDFGPVSARNYSREDEREVFQWLYKMFPDAGIRNELKQVALKRGFNDTEWSLLVKEDYDEDHINSLKTMDVQSWLRAVVGWRLGQERLGGIITDFPLGVIKPFSQGEDTLLREAGKGEGKNFLSKTPYQLLYTDVCSRVEEEFKAEYPDFTYEAVWAREEAARDPGLQYSMASLERTTVAYVLETILNEQSIAPEIKAPYMTCLYLDFTPAEIFGIDQELLHYIRPKEYQILFQLIQNELYDDEKPEKLRQLLSYLYNQTPVGGLNDIGVMLEKPDDYVLEDVVDITAQETERLRQGELLDSFRTKLNSALGVNIAADAPIYVPEGLEITGLGGPVKIVAAVDFDYYIGEPFANTVEVYYNQNGTAKNIQAIARFLGTRLGEQLRQRWDGANKTIAELIFGKDFLARQLPWDASTLNKIQAFLKKTPLSYLKENLPGKIPPYQLDKSIMDLLKNYLPWLNERYVDTLGRMLHLDTKAYELFEKKQEFNQQANKWAKAGTKAVQQAMNKALIETPQAIGGFIARGIASWFGKDNGGDLIGSCWEVAGLDKCDTNKGEVPRTNRDGTHECCSMDGGLVCEPQCRPKGNTACEKSKGEEKDGQECCYPRCRKCRLIPGVDIGKEACRKEEKKEGNLCCYERKEIPVEKGSDEKKCCQTIEECVTEKFLAHMQIIQDYIIDGPPISRVLEAKGQEVPEEVKITFVVNERTPHPDGTWEIGPLIKDATVNITGKSSPGQAYGCKTKANGSCTIEVPKGVYDYTVSAPNRLPEKDSLTASLKKTIRLRLPKD